MGSYAKNKNSKAIPTCTLASEKSQDQNKYKKWKNIHKIILNRIIHQENTL